MSDRFQDLRTFVAVVQGQGFNVAADRLGLVKSAVSRRIGEMERRLGTRLINRTTRQISVTEAGADLYWRGLKIQHFRGLKQGMLAGQWRQAISCGRTARKYEPRLTYLK